jgi:hypothetical protein
MGNQAPEHTKDARVNDFEGQALAKKKWAKIKGTWVLVEGEIPKTYIFVRNGETKEARINNYKNNRAHVKQ